MTDDHFHLESLEAFERYLEEAGFRPVYAANQSRWRGPIHKAFASLTAETTMDIVIGAGWPFRPPALFVEGLDTNHSTLDGFVCLWRDGDPSREWETGEGFFSRIEEWCANAERGWAGDDLGHDAFLNFQKKLPNVATFDSSKLGIHRGGWGDLHGILNRDPPRIDVSPGRASLPNHLRGLWFHAGRLSTPPPRQLSEVFRCLSRAQVRGLRRELDKRRDPRPFVPSGGLDLILFCWDRQGTTDLLVMACEGINNEVEAIALQPGPTDEGSLILRAGPDAPVLQTCRATLFGAGALGGYVGTVLAESGLGRLDIVDGEILLPENVVRHVAGHDQVGRPKVQAVHHVILKHAPWTEVAEVPEAPMAPARIRELIADFGYRSRRHGQRRLRARLGHDGRRNWGSRWCPAPFTAGAAWLGCSARCWPGILQSTTGRRGHDTRLFLEVMDTPSSPPLHWDARPRSTTPRPLR